MRRDTGVFGEEHTVFREGFRRFLEAEVVPHAEQWRVAGAVARTVFERAADQGFLGIYAPEDAGGAGVDDPLFGLVMVEECARVGALGFALMLVAHAFVAIPALAALDDDEARDVWLARLVDGSAIASVAARISDDATLGDVPGLAAVDLVVGRSADGVRAVAVSGDRIDLIPEPLGLRETGLGDLGFDARDATARTVGGTTASRALAADWMLWLAVLDLAAAKAALELAVAYVSERKVFGRPLSGFENTRVELARLRAEADAVSALEHVLLADRAHGVLSAERPAALRIAASSLHARAVDQCLQLHGGYGYIREYPIAGAYADAQLLTLLSRLEPEGIVADAMGLRADSAISGR